MIKLYQPGWLGARRTRRIGLIALVPMTLMCVEAAPALALPDLTVSKFRALGDVLRNSDGRSFRVRVAMTIFNRGTTTAGRAKVAAFAARPPRGPSLNVPLDTTGTRNRHYAWTPSLRPGASHALTGYIRLSSGFVGARLRLNVHVDSMTGEEFARSNGRIRESNERNNVSRSAIVAVPGHADAISSLENRKDLRPSPIFGPRKPPRHSAMKATPPKSKPEKWAVNLTRFVVWHAGERGGDEPLLFPLVFRARIFDDRSARVYMDPGPIRPGNSLSSGQIVRIRGSRYHYKRYLFDNVRRVTAYDVDQLGMAPEIFGVVFVAIEQNGTPVGRITTMIGRARQAMILALNRLMVDPSPTALATQIARIQQTLKPTVGEAIRGLIESGTDADRLVSIQTVMFLGIDTNNPPRNLLRVTPGLPAALQSKNFSWNSRTTPPVTFRKTNPVFPEDRRRVWKLEFSIAPTYFYGSGTI